ncbi:putative Calmodulin-binding domain, plant [Helianthus annuus]|nr:putative Calmodulin-binding domain, plant [Helianthus annuus]
MPTKGRDSSVKERRGRSPLFPRKVEIGSQTRSLVNPPSSLERKHALTAVEYRKIPIYDKPTVSSTLYALNTIKPPSVGNARLVPQSKVMSLKSKFSESKVTNSYMNTNTNTNGLTRKVIVHAKKQTRQPTKLLDALSSSKDDHNIVTHYEDDKTNPIVNRDILTLENCDKQRMDREDDDHDVLTCEVDEHISTISQQDQPDTSPDGCNDQHPRIDVDQERSNDVECHEEPDQTEVNEVPKEEEQRPNEVVDHGKKETAACENVIEDDKKEQRRKGVKALVGAFESLISLECNALQNNYQRNKMIDF